MRKRNLETAICPSGPSGWAAWHISNSEFGIETALCHCQVMVMMFFIARGWRSWVTFRSDSLTLFDYPSNSNYEHNHRFFQNPAG
jgi:hypothetical protein